ncbi:acetate--CoA ligase family protein, partial [Aduncisulcus paluster]
MPFFQTGPNAAAPSCRENPQPSASEKIGIIGVSSTRRNFGRIILDNVLAEGYPKEDVVVIRDGCDDVDGVHCVPSFDALDHQLDLLVVAIAAQHVPDLVDKVIELDCANSVMLIPGGMGETEDSKERAEQVIASINEKHAETDGGP